MLRIFSNEVSVAIGTLLVRNEIPQELIETATVTKFFIEQVVRWYDITTCVHQKLALSNVLIEEYEKALRVLRRMKTIMEGVTVLKGGVVVSQKPWSRGIIFSTKSLLELQSYLLSECGFREIALGRFTANPVESLFSVIRSTHPHPTALQVYYDLRLLSFTNLSSYQLPGSNVEKCLETMLTVLDARSGQAQVKPPILFPEANPCTALDLCEDNCTMTYIAGFLAKSILKTHPAISR